MVAKIYDLFAGPGGWDEAASQIGLRPLGIEYEPNACATAVAAGHRRKQIDVRRLDPSKQAGMEMLIASPPCQSFSSTGRGLAARAMRYIFAAIDQITEGRRIEGVRSELDSRTFDPNASLVVEPMHWIVNARPVRVALEQVPPVAPIWSHMATRLESLGYSVDYDILDASWFGVPQSRRRAILVASLAREVKLPEPSTHRTKMLEVLPYRDGRMQVANNNGHLLDENGNRMRAVRNLEQPSLTITGKGFRWSIDGRIETASVTDSASIQTFRAGYPWRGGITSVRQQIGNAIPVELARRVLASVMD